MTLIATFISRHGLVQASDSNLTAADGSITEADKLFPVGFGSAVMAVAGTYVVGREPMDSWVGQVVDDYSSVGPPILRAFASYLGARLTRDITTEQRNSGTLIHIAGYSSDDGTTSHPEMWFVRNIAGIDQVTGAYVGRVPEFQISEDFWGRDYTIAETRHALRHGNYQRYFNGFPDGRIAWNGVTSVLEQLFHGIWATPSWRFRPPGSLDELAAIVQLFMQTVIVLFRTSDYPGPYIGGSVQIQTIAPPSNCVDFV